MELPDRSQARSWEGKDVVDRDGQRLGRCVGVFADTATGVPEWLHIDVEGHVRSFVPAVDAAEHGGDVRVRFSRDAVLGAPSVGDDVQLSKAEEIELYRHYGVPVETGEGSVLPADDATAGSSTADDRSTSTSTTAATGAAAAAGVAASGGTAPVVGTSDRTSTGAAGSSGADTSVAETDADVDGTGVGTALSDIGTVSGAPVTPETGEELPVLDPAAASTPVPEDQVTYVDEPQDAVADETPAPAAAPPVDEPRPTLRRVTAAESSSPSQPAQSSPQPSPQAQPAASSPSSSGGGGRGALAPLGALAGVAGAVAVVLRARDRRARRRATPVARAGRLADSLRAGSALAASSAGKTLAGFSDAAELTRRSAATATSRAAKALAEQQGKAAQAVAEQQSRASKVVAEQQRKAGRRRRRAKTASAITVAKTSATRQQRALARAAGQQKRAVVATAAQQRRAARASLKAAAKAAAQQRKAARTSLSGVSTRRSSAAGSVVTVPKKVARSGRKVRRSLARKVWDTLLLGAGGGGYVLGAKAGRQRYDELTQVASAVADSPQVQSVTAALRDPSRRAALLAQLQQQAGSLLGRRGTPRT